MEKEIEIFEQKKYDEMLENLIPFLGQFASKSGKEGSVYFVDDNFVVKEIVNNYRQDKIARFFDCYVKEQQKFANEGCLIPRVYSSKVIKSQNADGSSRFGFYILEDKFQGNDIFVRISENFFSDFKRTFETGNCDVNLDQKDMSLDAMKKYINNFITQNNFLMGLSDDKFDALVLTVYKMFKKGKYSLPDVHAGNLLVNDKGFNVIDNYVIDKSSRSYLRQMDSGWFLTTRFLGVFKESVKISSALQQTAIEKKEGLATLYELQEKNMFYTEKVMKRVMISVKRCLSQNEPFELNLFISRLKSYMKNYVIEKSVVDDFAKEIEKGE